MLNASARRSRSARTFMDLSVGRIVKFTVTTPSSKRCFTSYPASENTRSIRVFEGSTSATNRRMPRSRPAAAKCSSNTEPRPRPWD